MSCIIDSGYTLGCASIGGVEKVWIGTYDSDVTYTYASDGSVATVSGTPTVYLMEQDIEYAGLTQTGQFSRENGTVFYESVLSVKFLELDAALRNLMVSLGRAPIFAIVKSNSGEFFILGVESAGRATEGSASLGVAQGDMNGVTMSFTWKSKNGAFLFDGTLLGTSVTIG